MTRLLNRFLLLGLVIFLMGCAGGTPVTDFSKRSVVYTWVDVKDIPGNRLTGFMMRNLTGPADERYYSMGWEKLGSGYLIWHNGFLPGRYEFHKMQMMSCAGPICTNTINEFTFGRPGTGIGRTDVGTPGVAFAGCYAFKRTRTGFFRPGEFDTRKAPCGASRAQMLQIILKSAKDPTVAARVRAAM